MTGQAGVKHNLVAAAGCYSPANSHFSLSEAVTSTEVTETRHYVQTKPRSSAHKTQRAKKRDASPASHSPSDFPVASLTRAGGSGW